MLNVEFHITDDSMCGSQLNAHLESVHFCMYPLHNLIHVFCLQMRVLLLGKTNKSNIILQMNFVNRLIYPISTLLANLKVRTENSCIHNFGFSIGQSTYERGVKSKFVPNTYHIVYPKYLCIYNPDQTQCSGKLLNAMQAIYLSEK